VIKSVHVLGSGGAFDTNQTNSSFLINSVAQDVEYTTLVDCGYNVFTKLKKMEVINKSVIEKISTVFITHFDDDHMGSLKSLLYYRYFMHGKSTQVIGNQKVIDYLKGMNTEVQGSLPIHANIVNAELPSDYSKSVLTQKGISSVVYTKTNHHENGFGVIFNDGHKNLVFISGDTKAMHSIESAVQNRLRVLEIGQHHNALLFHDFSLWDAPSRQVHACKSDCSIEYSANFLQNVIVYHNKDAGLEDHVYTTPFSENYTDVTYMNKLV